MALNTASNNDEELQRAIALSLEQDMTVIRTDVEANHDKIQSSSSTRLTATDHSAGRELVSVSKSSWILGLDRKVLEQERLARQDARKRNRSISPPPRKKAKVAGNSTLGSASNYRSTTEHVAFVNLTKEHNKSSRAKLRFPHGMIKKTFSTYHPIDDRTITIEDVIEKDYIKTAVLSAFILDPDWILTKKFDLTRTKFYMILHAKDESERLTLQQDFHGLKQARLCLPKLKGAFGCQHSKLMLLFYPYHLRIVVPSANLVDFDWGETGFMENSAFIIDLPRQEEKAKPEIQTSFAKNLLHFLEAQGAEADVRDGLLNFDFSATKGLAFIHTSEGSHLNSEASLTGLPSLSQAVRDLGLDTDEEVQIDFAASSIGSLNDEFINTIYEAAQGKDITTPLSRERRKSRRSNVRANLRIYFPRNNTVEASLGGPNNAGTICMNADYWNKEQFPRDIFRDYQSTRPGLLSHNKLMFVRGKKASRSIAWVYVGSANCSGSAWGTLVTKGVKLNCNNWESGVVVAVERPPDDLSDLGEVFKSVMDVPFKHGDDENLNYGNERPWFFMRKDR